jgi:hypothetical protein
MADDHMTTEALTTSQRRFADRNGATPGSHAGLNDGLVFMYRDDAVAARRWLIDEGGRVVDEVDFRAEDPTESHRAHRGTRRGDSGAGPANASQGEPEAEGIPFTATPGWRRDAESPHRRPLDLRAGGNAQGRKVVSRSLVAAD